MQAAHGSDLVPVLIAYLANVVTCDQALEQPKAA